MLPSLVFLQEKRFTNLIHITKLKSTRLPNHRLDVNPPTFCEASSNSLTLRDFSDSNLVC